MAESKLVNGAAVLVTPDLRRAAYWYREKIGFRVAENYDSPEPFASMYRDLVEIILVQSNSGPWSGTGSGLARDTMSIWLRTAPWRWTDYMRRSPPAASRSCSRRC